MHYSEKEKVGRERRLAKACGYVSDRWIPVNSVHLEKLQKKLSNSNPISFELDILPELKQDPALFMYCMRELSRLLRSQGGSDAPVSALEIFEQAGLDNLREILMSDAREISSHSLHSANSSQVSRIQEMLTSAAATETLCDSAVVDPDLGFSIALFRQLGFALIAWNYPNIYQDALKDLSEYPSLEYALAERLGFSPSLLALRLARRWRLPTSISATLEEPTDQDPADPEEQLTDAIATTLSSLCRVGEALARANNPDIYPNAHGDWIDARNAIEQRLGTHGLDEIKRKFSGYCVAYLEAAPTIFKAGLILDPEIRQTVTELPETTSVERLSQLFARCPVEMKSELIRLYEQMASGSQVQTDLIFWKETVFPASGFSAGFVYSVEPTLRALMPHAVLQKPVAHTKETVKFDNGADIVSSAFKSRLPIVRDQFGEDGVLYSIIAGAFGFSQRSGVLYLEIPRNKYSPQPELYLSMFRALAQSLNDCLRLS